MTKEQLREVIERAGQPCIYADVQTRASYFLIEALGERLLAIEDKLDKVLKAYETTSDNGTEDRG